MKVYAESGQTALVRQIFEQCRFILRRDLDISPMNETVQLFRRLTADTTDNGAGRDLRASDGSASVDVVSKCLLTPLPRLVVLPPTGCSSNDPAFVSAGLLLEDIVVGLCSLRSVSIVAPHSSWRIKKELIDDDVTIERFQIGYVLETTLLKTAKGSRLTTKLFDTASRTVLWADSFPLPDEQTENIHRDIAVHIILAIADGVERSELGRYERQDVPTAYHWHLIGQRYLRTLDLPDVRRASKAFRRAIDADPEFAPAYSGRARTLQREWLLLGRGEDGLLAGAEESGRRATALDPRDARGFWELGLCNLYMWRFDDSLAYYHQAEKLAPQNADIIADYGDALAHSGKPDEGLEKIRKAMELNPTPPEQYWWNAASMYFQLGEYRHAIEAVDKMEHPLPGLRVAAASWALLGNKKQAERCVAEFLDNYPGFRIEKWLALVPNRNPEDTEHYEYGLRAAGFK